METIHNNHDNPTPHQANRLAWHWPRGAIKSCVPRTFGMLCTVLVVLFNTHLASATSFDCAKATTKVEKMICADPELSRLDDNLGKVYSAMLKAYYGMPSIKYKEREWLRKRDKCSDAACLKSRYQQRIATLKQAGLPSKEERQWLEIFAQARKKGKERYGLLMSKDDELCNHMLGLFNADLKKYGPSGDSHQAEHEEFKRIPWKQVKSSYTSYGNVYYDTDEGALFDFNNDGIKDFVVRDRGALFNHRADMLTIFDEKVAKQKIILKSSDFLHAKNKIYFPSTGYPLSRLPKKIEGQEMIGVRVLDPFIYHDRSYLLMRPLFEVYKTQSGYAVIAKYQKGRFVGRNLTGKMEDICYFTRTRSANWNY